LVQESFPDAFVMSRVESARDSRYQVHRAVGGWEISFQPAADRRYFPVALASMLSKYLREVMMEQFNRFWREELPDLKPTAGYPGDATRFYREIQPIRDKLGIAHEQLWRER
jgi:ribonuclease HII